MVTLVLRMQAVTPAEVPDDFYNLTSADLVNMLKDCKTSYSPSEQPLLTKALRQKLKDEKEAKCVVPSLLLEMCVRLAPCWYRSVGYYRLANAGDTYRSCAA